MNISLSCVKQSIAYRATLAILFGLIGFVLNFLNFQLYDTPIFKLSILPGLFFPLLIALAWGWRYGLLSALAGGCQSMWWIWAQNGWGIFYAVPVFTLWIVWHGWWADHRRRKRSVPWYISSFAVEIPFRLICELGFYTIFPSLTAFNPPPWNPDIIEQYVPLSWIHTINIKHTVTAYILILLAYVALNLGPVRGFLGLQKKSAQKDTHLIYAGALCIGLSLWAAEALFHCWLSNAAGQTFWEIAVLNASPHDLFMRALYILLALTGAAVLAALVRRRALLLERIDHLNRVLNAIRKINKLITRKQNRQTLLQNICDCLVETRGYTHAWIVLLDTSHIYLTHAQSGVGKAFTTLATGLQSGMLPTCNQRALVTEQIILTENPEVSCPNCPLAKEVADKGCMAFRLKYNTTVYGLITVSLPAHHLPDAQEQSLFCEIIDDISYALHGLDLENKHILTKNALLESELRFSRLLENIPEISVQGYGQDGIIHYWNRASETLYGYSSAEAVGKNILDLTIPPQMHAKVRKAINEALQTGIMPPAAEMQLMKKNGELVTILSNHAMIRYLDKKMEFFCMDIDLTQRKTMEEALKANQAELQSIFRSAPVGIGLVISRVITRVNKQLCIMTGYTEAELLGQSARVMYFDQADYDRVGKEKYAQITLHGTGTVETRFRHKNGKIIDVILSSTPLDMNDLQTGVTFTALDITDRKNAEKALKKSEENLRTTLLSIGDAVISTDKAGNVVNMNPVAENLTGWKKKEAQGKPLDKIFVIINALTRKKADNPAKRALRLGIIVGLANHTLLIARDGSQRQVADSAAPIRDVQGIITGVVLVFRDVTQEYQLQNELQKMQKLESIGTLAGGIAHDFNNILMGLFGNIELAEAALPRDHPCFKSLEQAKTSMDRATRLTSQLLTFARGGEPLRQEICLGDLMEEIVAFDLSGSNAKALFKRDQNLRAVNADKGQIQQVFSNLTINARQAMPEGGRIHFTLENADILSKDDVPGLTPGKYVRVTVQDEGKGIDAEHLDRVFDPYFTTKQTGSGLGLTTVYSIINRHGGTLTVQSEPDQGTTFQFYLPACEQAKHPQAPLNIPDVSLRIKKPATILVMDDEEMICEVMTAMLEHLGFGVTTAPGGAEALELYKKALQKGHPFDAVIMDLTIPGGMGGKEAIGDLLIMDPHATAIASSGYADDPVMANYADYGFKGIATKPYTMKNLEELLRKAITD